MQPALSWIDLTAGDRDKMRRVLDLFNEQGTLDEMGLGNLGDAVSTRRNSAVGRSTCRLRRTIGKRATKYRLQQRLEAILSDDERRKISVIVIDVSQP